MRTDDTDRQRFAASQPVVSRYWSSQGRCFPTQQNGPMSR